MSSHAWLEETIGDLPCRVLLPEPYEPEVRRYPRVVSLHGSCSRRGRQTSRDTSGAAFASLSPVRIASRQAVTARSSVSASPRSMKAARRPGVLRGGCWEDRWW